MKQINTYYVSGYITIPVTFQTKATSNNEAIKNVESKLNSDNVAVLHGDIYTLNSNSAFPLVAKELTIKWMESKEKGIV